MELCRGSWQLVVSADLTGYFYRKSQDLKFF